jgi:hypothetical protein
MKMALGHGKSRKAMGSLLMLVSWDLGDLESGECNGLPSSGFVGKPSYRKDQGG